MKRTLLVLLFCGCGSATTASWLGTWKGSASFNTGRAPIVFNGTLVITDAGGQLKLAATSDAQGTPARSFSCAITSATVTDGAATIAMDTTCTLTATPADDCTYTPTFSSGTLTKTANAIAMTAQGRLSENCTSTGSTVEDFAMTLTAAKP